MWLSNGSHRFSAANDEWLSHNILQQLRYSGEVVKFASQWMWFSQLNKISIQFKVFIHDSYDFLDDNAETKAVSAKMEAFISLSPESTYSTPAVYRLPISMRNCLFENEMRLNVFQRYSYINCLAECRSDMILKLCGCIPYHLPNNGGVNSFQLIYYTYLWLLEWFWMLNFEGTHPICQMDNILCVIENKNVYSGALPGLNASSATMTIADSPCNCFPDCQLQQYPAEITSGYLNRTFAFNTLKFL